MHQQEEAYQKAEHNKLISNKYAESLFLDNYFHLNSRESWLFFINLSCKTSLGC